MNSTSFSDLYSRIQNWSADDEDILLRKIKEFTDNYTKKCEEINHNVDNIDKHINLLETEFYNSSNKLKNISIKRFMEHVVEEDRLVTDEMKPQKQRENQIILSKEERDRNILNKFRSSITKSLENLSIKNLIDIKENNENNSILDDDNMSVSSSKYLQNLQKQKNLNLKLPYIIGTIDYFKNEYLGITTNQSLMDNILSNSSFNNNTCIASNNGTNLNEKNVNNHQQSNYHQNNNPNYEGKLYDNDKLSMNMNLIEQIYEKKNTFINNTSTENELNEILYKNRKNNLNYHKENKNNDFFDENKMLNDQFRNIYKSSKLNNNNANTIQDQNFVDFTKVNNNIYYSETKNPEQLINNDLDSRNNYFKTNENEKSIKHYNDLISQPVDPLIENNKNIFDNKNEVINKEDRIIQKNINNNINFNRNHRVSLDNFLKKTNIIEDNLLDNEDDDNTGLFNRNNEAKFNLFIKNSKHNLFTNQDSEILENKSDEKIGNTNHNFFDVHKEEITQEQNKIETDQRLGNILKLIDESIEEPALEKIAVIKNEDYKVSTIKENEKNEDFEGKSKPNRIKNMNENKTNNLFTKSLFEEENDNIFIVKTKIQEKDKNQLGLDKKLINIPAEKKTSLSKAKNTLKMLFNEEDEEEEPRITNPLDIANKIDKKSTSLNEKLNYLLQEDKEKNQETKDEFSPQSKIDLIKKNEEENEKHKVNLNNKLERGLGLLVFDEEIIDEIEPSDKNILTIDSKNFYSNKEIKQENLNQNKSELHKVFEDIFYNNNGEINNNEIKTDSDTQAGEKKLNLIFNGEGALKDDEKLFEVKEKHDEKNDIVFESKHDLINNTLNISFENVKNTNEDIIKNSYNKIKIESNKNFHNLLNKNDYEEKENNIKISICEEKIHNIKTNCQESLNINENLHEFLDNQQMQSKFNLFNTGETNNIYKVDYDLIHVYKTEDQANTTLNSKENINSGSQKNNYNQDKNSTNGNEDNIRSNHNADSEQQLINIENDVSKINQIYLKKSTIEENTYQDGQKSQTMTDDNKEFEKKKNNNENTLIPVDQSSQLITDIPSMQPKINFEDLENEENLINKVEVQNKESNKNGNKTKQIKKAINFSDPLQTVKKNIKKEITITKADSIKKNPVNMISRKSVFEDSEDENDVEKLKLESEKIFNEKSEKDKTSNNDVIHEKLNTEKIKIDQHKDIIEKEKTYEEKSQEKRKSVKINNFSEIKKILEQKLQAFKEIHPEENNFFIPINVNNKPSKSFEYKSEIIQQKQEDNSIDMNFNISIVKNKKKPNCKRFTLQNSELDINPTISITRDKEKKEIFVDANTNIHEINYSTLVEEIKEYEFPKKNNFEELSQSVLLNDKIEKNTNASLDIEESKSENLNEIKNDNHESINKQTKVEEISEETNKNDKLNKHLENINIEKVEDKNNSKVIDFEVETNITNALSQDNQKQQIPNLTNDFSHSKENSIILSFPNKENYENIKKIEKSNLDINNFAVERCSTEDVHGKNNNLETNNYLDDEEDKNFNPKKNEKENLNIKKAKVIGFSNDEDENEQENFFASKSKDSLTKKKENEKIKTLKKKKGKNESKNSPKPNITNTDPNKNSKKTLNFDEE